MAYAGKDGPCGSSIYGSDTGGSRKSGEDTSKPSTANNAGTSKSGGPIGSEGAYGSWSSKSGGTKDSSTSDSMSTGTQNNARFNAGRAADGIPSWQLNPDSQT